jgi:type II secretory pathway pseudopilin PulG
MLVVISIVAITAPLVGVGIYNALKKERFEAAVRDLTVQLEHAQHRMLYADRDTVVRLVPTSDGTVVQLIDSPARGTGKPVGPARTLSSIHAVVWNGKTVTAPLDLYFYSSGRSMPQGDLLLYRGTVSSKEEGRLVRLAGYAHPILVGVQWNYGENGNAPYPTEVVHALSKI